MNLSRRKFLQLMSALGVTATGDLVFRSIRALGAGSEPMVHKRYV